MRQIGAKNKNYSKKAARWAAFLFFFCAQICFLGLLLGTDQNILCHTEICLLQCVNRVGNGIEKHGIKLLVLYRKKHPLNRIKTW